MSVSAARVQPAPPEAGHVPTVVIADDDANYRLALAAVIEQEPALRLVGVARSGAEAIQLALEHQPDIVLADVRMAGGGGADVARRLREAGTRTRVIALSAYDDDATITQMFDAGAAGYLLKGSTLEALVDGIVEAVGGTPSVRKVTSLPVARDPAPLPARRVEHEPTRVLIVDDSGALLTELNRRLIAAEPGFEVVGVATRASDAVNLAGLYEPHVALVDWRVPGGGIDLVTTIRERSPGTRIVGISTIRQPQVALAMLRAGASAFLPKPFRSDQLIHMLRTVAEGRMTVAPEISEPVLEHLIADLQTRGRATEERAIMRERVHAAMHGPLKMAYQPIYALREQQPVAVEALARFAVEPHQMADVWFREAAKCGLIADLDRVTMGKALDALEWLPRDVALHINLAPETLFAGRGSDLLDLIEPERVVVEITEHSDIDDYRHLNRALAPLRERGVRLAVDDVGAGFSSLRHVLVLEPDMIKLDVSLCRGIDSNHVRRAMARALTGFGQEVDKMVVAEGVETEGELEALLELGVTHAQGHLLGRPGHDPLLLLG